ncbi:TlpA disulfide reductase family protein [Niabella hibiscisoli]|uniref:TlpA disulfide reductase family protein n=1 Tax=Niabella hibiscisoli TaxID=1825928 RepID=UPI001F0D957F|nr:TlpA disulfide reductase family protein [Niabella hibiscisoli]MCH5715593.1 TlpA family protein disulfide reductase [Niabella hibiscisoli]
MTGSDKEQKIAEKSGRNFISKHGFTLLMGLIIITLFVSPEAKSWVIQQLMRTGLYNVKIEKKAAAIPQLESGFDFEDEKGGVQNTASLRGKVVFINFWASWCPPCRAEFPSIETLYARFKNNPEIFFLMINEDDDWAAGKGFLAKKNYITPMFKTKSTVPAAIYNGTLPTTLVLDKTGKVVFRHEGFANYASEDFINQVNTFIKE